MISREFETDQQERIDSNYKFWLGGFVEGEGSLTISITKNDKVKFGLVLQPEFNVAQHESGVKALNSFKHLFNDSGSVHKKSGSLYVKVYSIKGIYNIKTFVLPFYEKYVIPYSSKYKYDIFKDYSHIINILYDNRNRSMDKDLFIDLVKRTYKINPEGKGKQRKRDLHEVIDMIEKAN